MREEKIAGFACLCALAALGPPCPVRAEKPFARSRGAVEGLLGNAGPAFSPAPGIPLPFPDVPAPLPPGNPLQTTTPEKLRGIAAEAVLEQVQEIDERSNLHGQGYFSGHPDAPKIKAAFRDAAGSCRAPEPCVVQVGERALMYENGAELNRWYPKIGPIRGYRTTYSPANGETYPPLIEVELQLDKSLYERLFQEAQQLFGPDFFKDEKAAAERLAFLLAPRAAADLELSRLLDEQKIPDGLWVDEIEELRLSWEIAALRTQIAMHEAMLSDPGFKFLPAELDYLARRFGDGSLEAVLAPREYLFTDPAAQDWEALGKQSKMIPLLELSGKEPDEQVQDKNRQNTWNLIGELQRRFQAGATQRNILLQFQLQKAERAEAYLTKPDAVAGLRRALKLERERAQSFPALPAMARNRWVFHASVAETLKAAEDFDLAGLESRLSAAQAAAKKAGASFDAAAAGEPLKREYFTAARGLTLLKSLKPSDSEKRRIIIRSFAAMGQQAKEAIPALRDILVGRSEQRARAEAAEALGNMAPEAVPALMEGLLMDWRDISDDENSMVQTAIAKALVDAAPYPIPALAAAADPFPDRAYWSWRMYRAAFILGRIGTPAVPTCVRLLDSKNWNARNYAAMALQSMGRAARRALPALKELAATDPNVSVRQTAERAIEEILK